MNAEKNECRIGEVTVPINKQNIRKNCCYTQQLKINIEHNSQILDEHKKI